MKNLQIDNYIRIFTSIIIIVCGWRAKTQKLLELLNVVVKNSLMYILKIDSINLSFNDNLNDSFGQLKPVVDSVFKKHIICQSQPDKSLFCSILKRTDEIEYFWSWKRGRGRCLQQVILKINKHCNFLFVNGAIQDQ